MLQIGFAPCLARAHTKEYVRPILSCSAKSCVSQFVLVGALLFNIHATGSRRIYFKLIGEALAHHTAASVRQALVATWPPYLSWPPRRPAEGLRFLRKRRSGMGHVSWFEDTFGFEERGSFEEVKSNFDYSCGVLTSRANGRRFHVGDFELPTLAELRSRLDAIGPSRSELGSLSFHHYVGDVGYLQEDEANAGSVFQVASQFNCLQLDKDSTPESGIGVYADDGTQGSACALGCPAAAIYRNYFVNGGGQTTDKQVDCLGKVGEVVENCVEGYWRMSNGHCLPHRPGALARLCDRLTADEAARQKVREQLQVGVHWDTEVIPAAGGRKATKESTCSTPRDPDLLASTQDTMRPEEPQCNGDTMRPEDQRLNGDTMRFEEHQCHASTGSTAQYQYGGSSASSLLPLLKPERQRQHHRVCQVFCSALPVAYARDTIAAGVWEPFAITVLEAAFEATLAAAALLAMRRRQRTKVFLTSLGSGAFGNRPMWIASALQRALAVHRRSPLDVMLVHLAVLPRGPLGALNDIRRSPSLEEDGLTDEPLEYSTQSLEPQHLVGVNGRQPEVFTMPSIPQVPNQDSLESLDASPIMGCAKAVALNVSECARSLDINGTSARWELPPSIPAACGSPCTARHSPPDLPSGCPSSPAEGDQLEATLRPEERTDDLPRAMTSNSSILGRGKSERWNAKELLMRRAPSATIRMTKSAAGTARSVACSAAEAAVTAAGAAAGAAVGLAMSATAPLRGFTWSSDRNNKPLLRTRSAMDPGTTPAQRLTAVFALFDLNGDGYIVADEFKQVLLKLLPDRFDEKSVQQLFQESDSSADGVLHYAEFAEWLFKEEPETLEALTRCANAKGEDFEKTQEAAERILSRIVVRPYGVLGSRQAPSGEMVQAEALPGPDVAIVDPAGLPYISNSGPGRAGGASGAIYEWLGIKKHKAFPQAVRAAITKPLQAKLHRYDKGRKHCIHVVGPNFGERVFSRLEAVAMLTTAYHNVLVEFSRSGRSTLRMIPVSGGIFAGRFQNHLPEMTREALAEAILLLGDAERKQIGSCTLEMCIFVEKEIRHYMEVFHCGVGEGDSTVMLGNLSGDDATAIAPAMDVDPDEVRRQRAALRSGSSTSRHLGVDTSDSSVVMVRPCAPSSPSLSHRKS